MAATAQSAIAISGIDIGWSRVPPLSQGQPNVFLAQKDLSQSLMIIEPEISLEEGVKRLAGTCLALCSCVALCSIALTPTVPAPTIAAAIAIAITANCLTVGMITSRAAAAMGDVHMVCSDGVSCALVRQYCRQQSRHRRTERIGGGRRGRFAGLPAR